MTEEERKAQPVWQKIYNALPIVMRNCFPENFQEKFKWPVRDTETGLFKDIYCNFKTLIISI